MRYSTNVYQYYPENRLFDLYPSPSDSSPARVEESRREGMDIFILRGAGWQARMEDYPENRSF
jgi:hypothetical protein